jgi:excisionase family DNA binding protein
MKILKIKRSTFYSYVKRGVIPAVRLGHLWRIRREDVYNLNPYDVSKAL